MTSKTTTALTVGAGLIFSNFMYQAVTTQDWGTALERSIFQVAAIIAFYIALE